MTATSTARVIKDRTVLGRIPRHGLLKVLRGAGWKRGWIIAAHGDRLMPYPTGGFNNALTAINGGPLQVPGSDANGGLRVIAKEPGVGFTLLVTGSVFTAYVLTSALGYSKSVVVTVPTGTNASSAQSYILGTQAADVVDVAYTGTGGSAVSAFSAFSAAAVPYVRIYGLSGGEATNTDATAEVSLDYCSPAEEFFTGDLGLLSDGAQPLQPGQTVYAVDNQTVASTYTALCLPMQCISYENDLAFCRIQ